MTGGWPCAGGIVFDSARRLLLIERGQEPALGSWSVPGGRCRPGEPAVDTCVREVAEETGLAVEVLRFVGRVERDAPGGGVYVIDDFECRLRASADQLRAGDDAAAARWVTRAELATLILVPGLLDALREWGVLPD
ncbi:MAG: NUDIX hydrolase [Jatrophihabitans sp.]